MEQVRQLAAKISAMAQNNEPSILEIDIMMDHTRRLYEELIHLRQDPGPQSTSALREAIIMIDPETEQEEETVQNNEKVQDDEITAAEAVVNMPQEEITIIITETTPEPPQTNSIELPARNAPATGKDIRGLIGINDRYLFTNELFNNDKEVYNDVLDRLNTFDTLEDASNWINWFIHDQYKWDDESKTVQQFYEVLKRQFA